MLQHLKNEGDLKTNLRRCVTILYGSGGFQVIVFWAVVGAVIITWSPLICPAQIIWLQGRGGLV